MRAAAERPPRWTLSRAGIINVYQYGVETLHFGGGRLLLRGVNGSGKSTAMNMLLPFLLDADTRRIDAAGEQSGVLKAWMLSGREELQPQGYLWLEVAKGDAYLNFGCGIRASRATDQVTTWWFITSRRVGIDLHLVEGRVPVSRDALRTLIDPDSLFGQEQRADYRAELRRRIFGGADIEQHLHLLRTVRNPRVGDRLDAELPQYLMDALPQLSDSALDDAAQPLEDLEEHRRNVAELARTAEALDAVYATYRNYGRAELHRLADRTLEAARICRELRRDEEKARANYDDAVGRRGAAETSRRELEADLDRLRSAITALESSEAYMSGAHRQPDEHLPLHIEVTGPLAQQTPLAIATQIVQRQLATMAGLLSTKQHQALRNLLQGLVAREVAERLHAASELIERMNERLSAITTSHGIGVKLRWRRRDDLAPTFAETVDLLAKPPDLRTAEEDGRLSESLGLRIDDAHREDPGTPYRELIARVLDYREWHSMTILLHRPGRNLEKLSRRTALSEGEKKIVSYLPLFAAVAASCDGLSATTPDALRFVLLDDAFAKVSEDNHPKLFGLLVELDLDFIATSERLWGTHDTVPDLAITEVIRDADLETIVLEHSRWNAQRGTLA